MSWRAIILGAGGHARVLIDTLRMQGTDILGITIPNADVHSGKFMDITIIGDDHEVERFRGQNIRLVNGVGSIKSPVIRKKLFEQFKAKGFFFADAIHPSAVISHDVTLAEGIQIMAGVIIQTGTVIGYNTIINTKASVDHECSIGSHVHIAPGVTISGGVDIGDNVHIGTGATIIQGIKIGSNSVVGAGSVVIHDVPECATVVGIPAKVKEE